MTDYVFKYTNTPSASFIVKPYTINGPASPTSTTPYVSPESGVHAIAVNTPLTVVGKGIPEYGEVVQNNLLYLAENFCGSVPPTPPMPGMFWYKNTNTPPPSGASYPTARGMYVWNGSEWQLVPINATLQVDLDVNNNRIINVGDAVDDTDALNVASGNVRYLSLTGGTLTGNLLMSSSTIKVAAAPVASIDVTNKLYVDAAVLSVQNNVDDVADDLVNSIAAIESQLDDLYPISGGTISGDVEIDGNLSLSATSSLVLPTGTGVVNFGNRRLRDVGDPVLALDAANKKYVDNAIADEIANIVIPPSGTADGVVSAGSLDEATGVLTLTRTQGLPEITIGGNFAPFIHTHTADQVFYDPTSNQRNSKISEDAGTYNTVELALNRVDQLLSEQSLNPVRTVLTQTVSGNASFTFADQYSYEVWSDRLMVFVNGVKQYADTRAETLVAIDGAGGFVPVGIPSGSYPLTVIVDGINYTFNIVVTAGMTFVALRNVIASAMMANGVPAMCVFDQYESDGAFVFVHNASGTGHTITLGTAVGSLFQSIPDALPQVTEVGVTYSFEEVGVAGDISTNILFHSIPPVGSLIEIIVLV